MISSSAAVRRASVPKVIMVSPALRPLLASIASTVADYRQHEVSPPAMNAAHVETWADQFDPAVHQPLLTEMDAALKKSYLSRATTLQRLSAIAGKYSAAFWRSAHFLDCQQGGNSQKEMRALFDPILQATHGVSIAQCGLPGGPYIYLDDVSFSGNRVRTDLLSFVAQNQTPAAMQLYVITIAYYGYGKWWSMKELTNELAAQQKTIAITWEGAEFENNVNAQDPDVLRVTALPAGAPVAQYAAQLGFPVTFRPVGPGLGRNNVFGTAAGRDVLEQVFLAKGVRIRAMCPNLPAPHRPLGYSKLNTLGFGSTIVTYRNCPNNCPLAFWVAAPWYPLFPRKNN